MKFLLSTWAGMKRARKSLGTIFYRPRDTLSTINRIAPIKFGPKNKRSVGLKRFRRPSVFEAIDGRRVFIWEIEGFFAFLVTRYILRDMRGDGVQSANVISDGLHAVLRTYFAGFGEWSFVGLNGLALGVNF